MNSNLLYDIEDEDCFKPPLLLKMLSKPNFMALFHVLTNSSINDIPIYWDRVILSSMFDIDPETVRVFLQQIEKVTRSGEFLEKRKMPPVNRANLSLQELGLKGMVLEQYRSMWGYRITANEIVVDYPKDKENVINLRYSWSIDQVEKDELLVLYRLFGNPTYRNVIRSLDRLYEFVPISTLLERAADKGLRINKTSVYNQIRTDTYSIADDVRPIGIYSRSELTDKQITLEDKARYGKNPYYFISLESSRYQLKFETNEFLGQADIVYHQDESGEYGQIGNYHVVNI